MSRRRSRALALLLGLAVSLGWLLGTAPIAPAQDATPTPTPTVGEPTPTPEPSPSETEPPDDTDPPEDRDWWEHEDGDWWDKPPESDTDELPVDDPAGPADEAYDSADGEAYAPAPGAPAEYGWSGYQGPYDTARLVTVEAELVALGWPRAAARRVYRPFIIAGPAFWTDSWHAPRFGPGLTVRSHEGQDVFCRQGDPVLAVETGTIEFDEALLGGKVARLHRKNGGYWYYAHLSRWNKKEFSSGEKVKPGDVIGSCGNTGNARFTPPHVHFGFYTEKGVALDPMKALAGWLHQARRGANRLFREVTDERIARMDRLITERLFGDSLVSELAADQEEAHTTWPLAGLDSLEQRPFGDRILWGLGDEEPQAPTAKNGWLPWLLTTE